jgi:hypothetical protein
MAVRAPKNPVISGYKYGRLTAVYGSGIRNGDVWLCMCDCGSEVEVKAKGLMYDGARSCGCLRYDPEVMARILTASLASRVSRRTSILGAKFGRFTVIEDGDSAYLTCVCDCGERVIVERSRVTSGSVRSCGCLRRDVHSQRMIDRAKAHRKSLGVPEDTLVRPRNSKTYHKLTWRVRKRDGYSCVLCTGMGPGLHVHHIESWLQRPDLREDETNLVTLCKLCHVPKAHAGNTRVEPDSAVADILKEYIRNFYLNEGLVEKNGSLELTPEEESSIRKGIVPDRIRRNWGDLSPQECLQLVENKDTLTDTNNEKQRNQEG